MRRFTSPSNRDPRLPPRSRSLVAGVGLIGVGAYLYFAKPASTATAIAPVVDAHSIGIAISGSL